MPDNVLMKCGHNANALHHNKPCCVICFDKDGDDSTIIVDEKNKPSLEGRYATCSYFGAKKPKRRYANDECNYGCLGQDFCECGNGKIASRYDLAFFEYQPTMGNDKFYCGCHGWD